MKDKILLYLASGIPPSQVATIVGCSPGYISQLMKDESFRTALEAKILENPVEVDEALENKYASAEHSLLAQVMAQAPQAEFRDAVKGLETIARIQDMKAARKHPVLGSGGVTNNVQVVQLTLPAGALRHTPVFELNAVGEILAIDKQSLAPLSAGGVKSLFAARKELQAERELITKEL